MNTAVIYLLYILCCIVIVIQEKLNRNANRALQDTRKELTQTALERDAQQRTVQALTLRVTKAESLLGSYRFQLNDIRDHLDASGFFALTHNSSDPNITASADIRDLIGLTRLVCASEELFEVEAAKARREHHEQLATFHSRSAVDNLQVLPKEDT